MTADLQNSRHQLGRLVGVNKRENYYELHYATGEIARVYLIANGIFRYWLDPSQEFAETDDMLVHGIQPDPQCFARATAHATSDMFIINAGSCKLIFQQKTSLFSIFDEAVHRTRLVQAAPLELSGKHAIEVLKQNQNEYYYGGGVQNGHFCHKGDKLLVKTDGITGKDGVLAGVPFFWTNAGFGELRNTKSKGIYDFSASHGQAALLRHRSPVFDAFYIIGNSPQEILNKYYSLTGKPLMLPKYALGLGHLGNFIDPVWTAAKGKKHDAIRFEDNSYYSRGDADGKELTYHASLNGEDKYQFSARAMIDRYHRWDFPLDWLIPNYEAKQEADHDSYAAFASYAKEQGVHPGFWTEDDLTPPNHSESLAIDNPEADLNEARENLVKENPKQKPLVLVRDSLRPFQSEAVLAYGDIGGDWAAIKTQVATLLGAGLSGLPFLGAAVNGKIGGDNAQMAIRDLEWKVFTPLLFVMDDQSRFSKTPFAYNNKISKIMQAYLRLRKRLLPYLYNLARQAQDGESLVRPLFMEFPHEQICYGSSFGDEFMLGSQILVAPIVSGKADSQGVSVRDHIYLPDKQTIWIDLFTGERLMGGRVYNRRKYPLWQLPVFVRGGSIFDLGDRNFVFYPQGDSTYVSYNDDDLQDYRHNWATTTIRTHLAESSLKIIIEPTTGYYPDLAIKQGATLKVFCDHHPEEIRLSVDGESSNLEEYGTPETLARAKEGYYYDNKFSWTPEFTDLGAGPRKALIIKLAERDIKQSKIELSISNFHFANEQLVHQITDAALRLPGRFELDSSKTSAHSLTVKWNQRTPMVQIEVNGLLYTGIPGNIFTFTDLAANKDYKLRLRYESGYKVSEWSDFIQAKTKRDPSDYIITGVKAAASAASRPGHPVKYLLDKREATDWQTAQTPTAEEPVTLTFAFPQQVELSKLIYVPRALDKEGRPLKMRVEVSTDGLTFNPYGGDYEFNADCKNKVIGLRGVSAQAIRLSVLEATGTGLGASSINFYRPIQN